MLSAQRQAGQEEPGPDDIFEFGTLGTIIQLLRLPDGVNTELLEEAPILAINRQVVMLDGRRMGMRELVSHGKVWAFNGVAFGPSGAIYVTSDTESLVWRIREMER